MSENLQGQMVDILLRKSGDRATAVLGLELATEMAEPRVLIQKMHSEFGLIPRTSKEWMAVFEEWIERKVLSPQNLSEIQERVEIQLEKTNLKPKRSIRSND